MKYSLIEIPFTAPQLRMIGEMRKVMKKEEYSEEEITAYVEKASEVEYHECRKITEGILIEINKRYEEE